MNAEENRLDFTNAEGMRTRVFKDEHGHIVIRFTVDDRDAIAYFTPEEVQELINGIVRVNNDPIVGAWGLRHGRPIHIPSYNQGHADATGGVV